MGDSCVSTFGLRPSPSPRSWCENKMRKEGQEQTSDVSPYHLGCFKNFQETLGSNPLLWLLPIGGPPGDGLTFQFDASRLGRPVEVARGIAGKDASPQSNLDYDGRVYTPYMKPGGYAGHGFAG